MSSPVKNSSEEEGGGTMTAATNGALPSLEDALAAVRRLSTAPMNLGRFTPKTAKQRESALAGIAQCDTDWPCNIKISDELIAMDEHWKAGYRVRYHELLAAQAAAR